MKKSVTLFLAAILCLGLFAGCGKDTSSSGDGSAQMKDGESVQTVVDKIVDEIGMQMPSDIDDGIYKDLFYIDTAADCEEYYGKMAMTMTSADNVVAIKAKPDKKTNGCRRVDQTPGGCAQFVRAVPARPERKGAKGSGDREGRLCIPVDSGQRCGEI